MFNLIMAFTKYKSKIFKQIIIVGLLVSMCIFFFTQSICDVDLSSYKIAAKDLPTIALRDTGQPIYNFGYCPEFKEYNFSICIHHPEQDTVISGSLIKGEVWERRQVEHVRRWLLRDPDLNLIDIGANIGLYSLVAAGAGRTAVAVEPLPRNYRLLAVTLRKFHLTNAITIVPFAVSNRRTNITLETNSWNQGLTVLAPHEQNPCLKNGRVACSDGQTILLDDLLYFPDFSTKFKKAVVKIDIEGHEIPTLLASKGLWKAIDVQVLLMEWQWVPIMLRKQTLTKSTVYKFLQYMKDLHFEPRSSDDGFLLHHQDLENWPIDVAFVKKSFPF